MNLQALETKLRALVETHLIRVFPGQRPEDLVVARLLGAVQANVRNGPGGVRSAPNVYTLVVHPASAMYWKERALVETLVDLIATSARDSGLDLRGPATISFMEDPRSAPGEFRVLASHSTEPLAETQDAEPDTHDRPAAETPSAIPENAFLIVDGVKEFALKQAVVNIGRRLDNTLVVDDPRVSRHHAQLRAIKGRFVLFDLNSSGGTFINGQRTAQSILYPGDVISLAGVSLIFGEDSPLPQRDLGRTSPRSALGAERRTAIIQSRPSQPGKRP